MSYRLTKQRKRSSTKDHEPCPICGILMKGHPKCMRCTILIGGGHAERKVKRENKTFCVGCAVLEEKDKCR